MIAQQHQRPRLEVRANAAGGVGQYDRFCAKQTHKTHGQHDLLHVVTFIVVDASLLHDDGNAVALTASQKEAARNAAQSALEITPGTEVFGTSTALLLPNVELAEGETLTLTIDAAVIKNDAPTTEQEQETAE